jgi:insulysin
VLQEPLFNDLRSEQQLGYFCHVSPTLSAQVLGLVITVLSEHHPNKVVSSIEDFLAKQNVILSNMAPDVFESHVQSVSTLLLEPANNIDEQVDDHWSAVWSQQYNFYDRYEVRMISTLSTRIVHTESCECADAEYVQRACYMHICVRCSRKQPNRKL